MKQFGEFLSNLRSSAGLSLEELGKLVATSRSTLSRLENDDIPRPFKANMRQLVITLAELLCTSQKETERYLELADIERSYLTDTEEIALGFIPPILTDSPEEATNLEYLRNMCEQRYHQFEVWEQQLQPRQIPRVESNAYKQMRRKKQECALFLRGIQQRLDVLNQRWEKQERIEKAAKILYAPGETAYFALATYLEQQRTHLLDALAPGSTNLHVKDIVGNGGLFIRPAWKISGSNTPSTDLVEHLIDALTRGQRVLILGEAGQGKTILLKQIFTRMVDRFLDEPQHKTPIPLYIPLREFPSLTGNPFELAWSYFHEEFPLPFEEFTSLVRNNRIAFLLDGFDEIRGELTQRSINERASSRLFMFSAVLTCRKNFYEFYLSLSTLQEQYPQKIELQPLELTNPVRQYIAAFCHKRERIASGTATTPEKIVDIIQANQELRDLAQRPLLLVMMLDIFTDTQETDEEEWGKAKLYRKYTEKWLKNEASKPDSVLRWNEKAALMQELAWSIYLAKTSLPSRYGSYQNVTFTQSDLSLLLERFATQYRHIPFIQLMDDICFRSFLIANDGDTYYFIHKSFQEYYVAKYIFESLRNRERSLNAVAEVFREFLPVEIGGFLKNMLQARDFSRYDRDLVIDILTQIYQQNSLNDTPSVTIRQNASAYLAFLGTPKAIQFLEQMYEKESNKWVQRGMMVGLALFCGRSDILDRYIDMILNDPEAASINIGYHLVYYGDQPLEEGYYDRGGEKCDGTVRSIFRRLRSEHYRIGWVLDLLTLRTLLCQRGLTILSSNDQYISFLEEFLDRNHLKQGKVFHQEKQRLQEIIKGGIL